MERMDGVPISQVQRLRDAGVDIPKLARDGVTIFFTQVFRDGFFHADMHPGNIQVSIAPATFGRYISLDFGIVGTLTEFDKDYLAQNFIAFFHRDYKRVAELHVESGWVPPMTRVDELEGRDPRGLRAAVRPAAEGHLARPGAAAAVPDLAPLQRRDPAAAGAAAEDAAQRRRAGPRARPRARPVEHRQALPRALDGRAGRLAGLRRAAEEGGAALRAPAAAAAAPAAPALQPPPPVQQRYLEALLVEQRRTNRLLTGVVYTGLGFLLGLVAMQIFLRLALSRLGPAGSARGARDLYCRVVFFEVRRMPIYAYRCTNCGHAQDVLRKISDPALTVCPACGAADARQAGHGGRLPAQGLGLVRHRFPRRQEGGQAGRRRRTAAAPADKGRRRRRDAAKKGDAPTKATARPRATPARSAARGAGASRLRPPPPRRPPAQPRARRAAAGKRAASRPAGRVAKP